MDLQSTTSLIDTKCQAKQQQFTDSDHSIQAEILHYMADPQILVNFVTPPGELPRSIALERRRRAVANVDFVKLFTEFTQRAAAQNSALPLEVFDDDSFETKALGEFFHDAKRVQIYDANKGQMRDVKGLYGHCFIGGVWQKCVVIGQKPRKEGQEYDDRLLVILRDEKQQKFWVPRLYVYVWGEDSEVHLARLENALHQRALRESLLRYEECVNNMPVDSLLELSPEALEQLERDPQFAAAPEAERAAVVAEVERNFMRAQNEILFQLSLQQQPSLIKELGLELAVDEKRAKHTYDYNNEFKQIYPYYYMLAGYQQAVDVDYKYIMHHHENYMANLERIRFDCFFTSVEAIKCLQLVNGELFKLTEFKPSDNYNANDVYFKLNKIQLTDLPYDYTDLSNSIYHIIRKQVNAVHPFNIKTYSLEEFKTLQNG